MNFAETEILRRVFRRLTVANNYQSVRESSALINYKCPHCDDVKSRKRVGRGFFTVKNRDGVWKANYTCHNGGCDFNVAMGAIKYLKKYHPDAFKEFKRESGQSKNSFKFNVRNKVRSNNKAEDDWQKVEREYMAKIKREEEESKAKDREAMKHFIPITKPSLLRNTAIKYCKDRMIPESVYNKFFVAVKGSYKNRIIIPYFRKDGKPTYFQARGLYDYVTPKYKNRIGSKQPYNIDFVDPKRPITIFEGALDSIFLENSFALGGVSINESTQDRFEKSNLYFIFDNDVAGRVQNKKMLELGYAVFNWKVFLSENGFSESIKDWNELVLSTGKTEWKIEDVLPYFVRRELNKQD